MEAELNRENSALHAHLNKRLLVEIDLLLGANSFTDTCQIAANAMATLMGADQAVLWIWRRGGPKIEALSGISSVDRNIDFTHWFEALASEMLANHPRSVEFIPEYFDSSYLQAERSIYLLSEALHARLVDENGQLVGGLFVACTRPFEKIDLEILGLYAKTVARICGNYRGFFQLSNTKISRILPGWRSLILVGVIAAFFIPIKQSAIGIAEVSPRDAIPVTATQDGVIEKVLVRPNQEVIKGAPLVKYDGAIVQSKLFVALQNIGVAEAELQRVIGKSFGDDTVRADLRMLRARVSEKSAETQYLKELAKRLEIQAKGDGVVILNDTEEWAGRPVQSGERIMLLANPKNIWITIYLPVEEAIPLKESPEVKINLDISPLETINAKVVESSYEPVLMPDGRPAYLFRAAIEGVDRNALPRIGLRGVARLYGEPMKLGYLVSHKPLRSLRRMFGW
jgi:multidrug resistance efflux pump